MTVRVLVALGHHWEGEVVTRLEQVRAVEVTRRCVDLPDLLAAAAAGVGDTALVSADLRGVGRDAFAQLAQHGIRVVGMTPPGQPDAEVRLRQLGLTRVLAADASPTDLGEALDGQDGDRSVASWVATHGLSDVDAELTGLVSAPSDPAPDDPASTPTAHEGQVVTVWGPTGSPGRTTVAVNLAAELAASGREVLLIDADTYGASIAQTLALLDEAPGVAAAARASEHGSLDLPSLARLAPEVVPRLRVLTGLPRADRWTELRPAALEHLLSVSRGLADVIVVDCAPFLEEDEDLVYDTLAPRRNGAAVTAVEVADEVVAVGAADPVGLQRLVRALQELADRGITQPRVVVTKLRSSAVGPQPRQRVLAALERFVDTGPVSLLPWDPETLDAAMLTGRALNESHPNSPLRQSLAELAAAWLPDQATTRTSSSRRRTSGFFARDRHANMWG